MGLIDRYILRAVLTPLALALCVAGMLLLLEQMLRLFDFVLAEQGPVDVVWRMLANLIPHYLGLALPLGAFLGVMLAFRSLSMSSELDALHSSGASMRRLLRPVYGLFLLLMVLDFALVSYIEPFARYRYEQIRFDVASGAFGVKIPQGSFVDIAEGVTLRLGGVNSETREAEDIFLEQREADGRLATVTARYGAISTNPDFTRLLLKLRDGRQLFVDPDSSRVNALSFDTFDLEVELPESAVFRSRGGDAREATFDELLAEVRAGARDSEPLWNSYRARLHWVVIHPLSYLVMPILAAAMGVTGRRRASTLKPVLGVAILIVYHELLEEWGQIAVRDGALSPYVAMWGVLAGFAALSFALYNRAIDQARVARVAARQAAKPPRVLVEGGLDADSASDGAAPADMAEPALTGRASS
ncbi:MAG: LptF/LptG family permease [Amphiplicatus sp.]